MSEVLSLAAAATGAASTGPSDVYLIWAIVLLLGGLALLGMELFIPSGGLIGAVAGASFVGSLAAFFAYDQMWGFAATGIYVVVLPILIIGGFKYWINSPYGRSMVLGGEEDPEADPEAAAGVAEQARRDRVGGLAEFVGHTGETETALRPVGTVKIDGRRIDALAEGGIIEAGQSIVVVAAYDNQLKVRARG